ncbi:N-6 DNA methylase [Rhizobium sp.]|uniref:Eco57I restriction-modification methylase domain-containing protein n=1 Tax=Rhizobium sp. TaxID=391 RepID=UPI0034C63145
MQSTSLNDWLQALGYADAGDAVVTSPKQVGRRPYAAELHDLLNDSGDFQLDAVFVVENTPTVCFADARKLVDASDVDAIRQRLWNQNLASALLVFGDNEVRAYSIPKWKKSPGPEVISRDNATDAGHWSASEFQSSEIQQRLSDWFDPGRRVDRQLLRQLTRAVNQLNADDEPLIATRLQAQMLLAQVLFISYLEHRGIVGDAYRELNGLRTLHDLVDSRDGAGIDRLIENLKRDFNGDFLEPTEIRWSQLDDQVLAIVSKLLSRVDLETGQRDFWNYDFSHIPVELLSGIYEKFLEPTKKTDGAYYTPRVLAELAVEQAFEGIENLAECRVYDGACGSGILVTTAFRKIIAYRQAELRRDLAIQERIDLLKATVFGSDINSIACRVTAFSLYLCLLERLSPPDLARRDGNQWRLPNLVGVNIFQSDDKSDQGDFFSPRNPLATSGSFDIVISNPPWRELKEGENQNAIEWASRNKFKIPHHQLASIYAAKAVESAKKGGRIVLILPTSLITAPTNADFLRQLSVRLKLDRLINFSDFRRLMFAQAEHACTILRAENVPGIQDNRVDGEFEYWVPKVDLSFAFNRLTLHEYDMMTLPRATLIGGNDRLRRGFWGNSRDESLYQRLCELPQLDEAIEENGWVIAKGYHMRDGDKAEPPEPLLKYRLMPTDALNSPHPIVDIGKLISVPINRGVASYGEMRLYEGERVLWPDGTTTEMEIRSAYASSPFCIPSGVGGLWTGDALVARFLTLYFRSSLAKYWLILTGYTAQTERARVTLTDVQSLPFIQPKRHPNSELAATTLLAADDLLKKLESADRMATSKGLTPEERANVDTLVFEYLGLSDNERMVVLDMINLVATSIQPSSYSVLLTPLQSRQTKDAPSEYVSVLTNALQALSRKRNGSGEIWARVVDRQSGQGLLDVVHVSVGHRSSSSHHGRTAHEIMRAICVEINNGRPLDFFAMPNSTFVWGNDIYIVKPAKMRFWSKSAALRDADEIVSLIAPINLKASSEARSN